LLSAQARDTAAVVTASTPGCARCAEWNVPHRPFRIYGNTYYVGTHGLSAILITSPDGHVLIDAGLPESAPLVLANIQALGFRVADGSALRWALFDPTGRPDTAGGSRHWACDRPA
jgi:metallo-beta-lactamase class B